MSAEDRLKKFLIRATQPSAKNTRLSLYQVIAGGGESLLRNHDISSEYGYGEEKIATLQAELWGSAQDDADGHLGTTTYVVVAYQGVRMGERSPMFRLRSQEASLEGGGVLSETEAANPTGLLAQLMRHNEAKDRQLVIAMEILSRQSTSIIDRQATQIEHYDKRHWDNVELAEKMMLDRDNNALEHRKQNNLEKRQEETIKMLKPLVPLVMSKIKGLSPAQKAGAQSDVLKALMSNVTPDQMEKIAEILGPQSLALAELYLDSRKDEFENEQSTGEAPKH